MNELKIQDVISETKDLWNQGKKVMVQIAYNLHQIQESDVWRNYDTFPAFVESELGIGRSQTSKLLTIASFYLDKFTPEQIGPTDYERLYSAAKLGGSPELALSRAKTWSRDDFKENKAEIDPHKPDWVKYCKICELGELKHPPYNGD